MARLLTAWLTRFSGGGTVAGLALQGGRTECADEFLPCLLLSGALRSRPHHPRRDKLRRSSRTSPSRRKASRSAPSPRRSRCAHRARSSMSSSAAAAPSAATASSTARALSANVHVCGWQRHLHDPVPSAVHACDSGGLRASRPVCRDRRNGRLRATPWPCGFLQLRSRRRRSQQDLHWHVQSRLKPPPNWRALLLERRNPGSRPGFSEIPLLGEGGRSRWREDGGQVSRVHLEEIDRLGQAAESPGAKAPETDPLWERLDDRRAYGRGQDDLPPVRREADARAA